MKKKLSAIAISLLLFSCGNPSLEGDLYEITSQEDNEILEKTSIYIELSRKVSEDTLEMIAMEIKENNPDFERLYIFYYMKGQDTKGIAWATTHFEPELTVSILGSSEVEDKAAEIEKFGLTMEERKAIFVESYKGEVDARKKADAKYPMSTADEVRRDSEKYAKYENELMEEMQKGILKKYAISDSVYWEISVEGVELNWIPAGVY